MTFTRREFLNKAATLTAAAMLPVELFSQKSSGLQGFSKIYNNANHEVGVFAPHGQYAAKILSAYHISNAHGTTQKHVMKAHEALELTGWKAVGNGGWFEDYNVDRPSALYVEEGVQQQGIILGKGEGIVTIGSARNGSQIRISHIREYTPSQRTNFPVQGLESAVQATLLQYQGKNLIGAPAPGFIPKIQPRTTLAVGKEGMLYLVFKNADQEKALKQTTARYQELVDRGLPDVVQLDSYWSSQLVFDPSIAMNPKYIKNSGGKFIGSELDTIQIAGKQINYKEREPREIPVANLFLFR